MHALKLKILDELLNHMDRSRGNDLKSLLDRSKEPPMTEEISPDPKGISVEKVSLMGKPKDDGDLQALIDQKSGAGVGPEVPNGDEEMTEDELKELLSQLGG